MIGIDITLQPKQKEAFNLSFTTPVLFYGGAKGGGKSYLVRARELYRRMKYPKTKGLIVRKTYPDLLSNHIHKFFEEYPIVKKWYKSQEKMIYWPNGSITEFSYLGRNDDVYNYQGREYEDISIDEITQHQEFVFKVIRSSNRTTNKTIMPTMLLTGNPGGIGHGWCKRMFVDRNFKDKENPQDFNFVQAKVDDNHILIEANPQYKKQLEDLPDHLRRAYLEGDWSIFAGQMFTDLTESKHLIDPIQLPKATRYFAGYDYGYNHPFAFTVCAVTPDGQFYVVSHIRKRFCQPDEQARLMLKMLENKGDVVVYCGHDITDNRGGRTIEDQLLDAGFKSSNHSLELADIDHIQGVAALRKMFSIKPDGTPYLQFFKNTREVFDCILEQQINPDKPEDVLKLDAIDGVGGDDLYDSTRYAIRSWTLPRTLGKTIKPDTGEALMQKLRELKNAQRGWR